VGSNPTATAISSTRRPLSGWTREGPSCVLSQLQSQLASERGSGVAHKDAQPVAMPRQIGPNMCAYRCVMAGFDQPITPVG
jgi:hypothetical protein